MWAKVGDGWGIGGAGLQARAQHAIEHEMGKKWDEVTGHARTRPLKGQPVQVPLRARLQAALRLLAMSTSAVRSRAKAVLGWHLPHTTPPRSHVHCILLPSEAVHSFGHMLVDVVAATCWHADAPSQGPIYGILSCKPRAPTHPPLHPPRFTAATTAGTSAVWSESTARARAARSVVARCVISTRAFLGWQTQAKSACGCRWLSPTRQPCRFYFSWSTRFLFACRHQRFRASLTPATVSLRFTRTHAADRKWRPGLRMWVGCQEGGVAG